MLSPSFLSPLTTATTTTTNLSSPPHHVRSRPRLAAATSAGATTPPMASLYEILGIPADASGGEIKAAYRRLARVCHPDAVATTGDRNGPSSSADEFMKLHAAYSTLSDPEKRASYDRSLFRRRQRSLTEATETASRFSGYVGRNWETDQCW